MLDIRAAIKHLKIELKRVNEAVSDFEALASDHYAARESRAQRRVASARYRKLRGKAQPMDRFAVLPPVKLNPDVYLWLQ